MNKAIVLAALTNYTQTLREQTHDALQSLRFLEDQQAKPEQIKEARDKWQLLQADQLATADEIALVERRLASDQERTAKASPKVAADGKPRLFEVSALVHYTAVICAVSAKDALQEVETWENAWHDTADLIDVSDVEVSNIRVVQDARSESHDITIEAGKLLKAEKGAEEE